MKTHMMRRFAAGMALLAAAALMQGCMSRPFHIRKHQVVVSVNAQGQPGRAANQFSTADTAAYCWFEYQNAPANKLLKCEITYTGPEGNTETRDTTVSLKPGSHKVHFGVEVPRGEGLNAGTYEGQAYDGTTALFGTPLRFMVSEPGAPVGPPAPLTSPTAPTRRAPEATRPAPAPGGQPPAPAGQPPAPAGAPPASGGQPPAPGGAPPASGRVSPAAEPGDAELSKASAHPFRPG